MAILKAVLFNTYENEEFYPYIVKSYCISGKVHVHVNDDEWMDISAEPCDGSCRQEVKINTSVLTRHYQNTQNDVGSFDSMTLNAVSVRLGVNLHPTHNHLSWLKTKEGVFEKRQQQNIAWDKARKALRDTVSDIRLVNNDCLLKRYWKHLVKSGK